MLYFKLSTLLDPVQYVNISHLMKIYKPLFLSRCNELSVKYNYPYLVLIPPDVFVLFYQVVW